MGRGRKDSKRAAEEESLIIPDGESVMRVVDLRGSNIIERPFFARICKEFDDKLEVMDAHGKNSLAIIPAKFQKTLWIKRGNFVVVNESGREEAAEFGRKIGCVVTQVLFYEHVRMLQKSPEWPELFKTEKVGNCKEDVQARTSQTEENEDSSEDDGLPPLEANTNRLNPYDLASDEESGSETDTDS